MVFFVSVHALVNMEDYSRSRNRAREMSHGRPFTSIHWYDFIWFLTTWIMVDNSSKCLFMLISMLGRVKNN